MAKCVRVSNNEQEVFRSGQCNIKPSLILEEAEIFLFIWPYTIEDHNGFLLTLEPINWIDRQIVLCAFQNL